MDKHEHSKRKRRGKDKRIGKEDGGIQLGSKLLSSPGPHSTLAYTPL